MKKKLGFSLYLAMVVIVLITFSSTLAFAAEAKYTFAMVRHVTSSSFWKPVIQGANDAAKQFGVEVQFMGPPGMDHLEQVNTIESLISAKIDGIATTLTDPEAYNAICQKALDAGIPVIGLNSDSPTNPRLGFVGADEYGIGKAMAEQIVKHVGEKGKVLLTLETPGHVSLELRLKGAKDVLDKYDYEYDVLATGTDLVGETEVIMNYYQANKDSDGFFAVSGMDTAAAGIAVEKLGLKGKVYSGGCDLVTKTLENIKNGYSQFTIDQNPYLQGYYSICMLYFYKEYAIYPSMINTGGGIVDASNVDKLFELSGTYR